jgi:hypothetical protein
VPFSLSGMMMDHQFTASRAWNPTKGHHSGTLLTELMAILLGIPIVPSLLVSSHFNINNHYFTRLQIPLWLAWAVTIHNSPRLILWKVKIGLGTSEFCLGLCTLSATGLLYSTMFVEHVNWGSRDSKLGGWALDERRLNFDCGYHTIWSCSL